eukprot:COSAG02_NODE_904_length_16045_cov_3920.854697_14_plen_159_part_00
MCAGQGLDTSAPRDAPTSMIEGMRGKAWSYTKTAAASTDSAGGAALDRGQQLLPAPSTFSEAAATIPAAALPAKPVAHQQRSARSAGDSLSTDSLSTGATATDDLQHSVDQGNQQQHADVDNDDVVDDGKEEQEDTDEGEEMDAAAAFIDELDTSDSD